VAVYPYRRGRVIANKKAVKIQGGGGEREKEPKNMKSGHARGEKVQASESNKG